ncbi:nucleotide pyrophosphohydrolase [Paenibacillus albidus]|uniref:Nucleotide pyrophosphohydrolase n=1 Tax=Paenibacillus albidus TaxID=2041023 RepID=A0A917C5E0_9BACL|nr:nucleotide pyrophosphohydrolase [Paenibacillus albidus]MBT2292641.1 nucleotide pyrophosphohydrolase [Paenibacillus albidus]GGF71696.1 nucleotide pyrophosphohydrolase [Paenibacillus albidus]
MDKLIEEIIAFRDERGWTGKNNPKDLAISISLEASELLEHFQWGEWKEPALEKREEIGDELADVLIYCITMAHGMDFDIEGIIRSKMAKNAQKYPVGRS